MTRQRNGVRVLYVLLVLAVLVPMMVHAVALAQDATPVAPVSFMDVLLAAMKAVFPAVIAFLAGFLTKGISYLLSLSPAPWLGLVSSAVGAIGAAMTSAAEGVSVEAMQANAVVGAGSGALGHAVMQTKPIQPAG